MFKSKYFKLQVNLIIIIIIILFIFQTLQLMSYDFEISIESCNLIFIN